MQEIVYILNKQLQLINIEANTLDKSCPDVYYKELEKISKKLEEVVSDLKYVHLFKNPNIVQIMSKKN